MQLNDVQTLLADQQFPASASQLSESIGDEQIDHPEGSESLAEVLRRCGSETFDCPEDAVTAVYGGVGSAAVGRVGYSDRDPTPIGTYGPEQVSF